MITTEEIDKTIRMSSIFIARKSAHRIKDVSIQQTLLEELRILDLKLFHIKMAIRDQRDLEDTEVI